MKIKQLSLIFIFFFLIFRVNAGGEWQLYTEKNGLQFYYKYTECHNDKEGSHKEYILFRVVNTTQLKLKAEWERRIWYDGKCMNCGSTSKEYHNILEINAGETLEACCETNTLRTLKICSRLLNFKDSQVVTKFEFENLTVNPSN